MNKEKLLAIAGPLALIASNSFAPQEQECELILKGMSTPTPSLEGPTPCVFEMAFESTTIPILDGDGNISDVKGWIAVEDENGNLQLQFSEGLNSSDQSSIDEAIKDINEQNNKDESSNMSAYLLGILGLAVVGSGIFAVNRIRNQRD